MSLTYQALYTDDLGSEATTVSIDEGRFTLTVRGVEFVGFSLDSLGPPLDMDMTGSPFSMHQGNLCGCELGLSFPIAVLIDGREQEGLLHAQLRLPTPGAPADQRIVALVLQLGDRSFRSPGSSASFEDELLNVQASLPAGTHLKTCFSCAFSDYSPYGNLFFGDMLCFRDHKDGYTRATCADDMLDLPDGHQVQETGLCAEFELREPSAGRHGRT